MQDKLQTLSFILHSEKKEYQNGAPAVLLLLSESRTNMGYPTAS